VTDRCSLRCTYCTPAAGTPGAHPADVLSDDEIVNVVLALGARHGLEQVRITGGEPLLRPKIDLLVAMLSAMGVPDLGLTTNGQRLAGLAKQPRSSDICRHHAWRDPGPHAGRDRRRPRGRAATDQTQYGTRIGSSVAARESFCSAPVSERTAHTDRTSPRYRWRWNDWMPDTTWSWWRATRRSISPARSGFSERRASHALPVCRGFSAAAVDWLTRRRVPGAWAIMPRLAKTQVVEPLFALYEFRSRFLLERSRAPYDLARLPEVITPEPPEGLARAWSNVNTPQLIPNSVALATQAR
jgi:hypothetical protein